MRRTNSKLLSLTLMAILGLAACSHDLYDSKKHGELIDEKSTVGEIDENHTWVMTSRYTVEAQLPEGADADRLLVLQRGEGSGYEVLAEQLLDGEQRVTIPFAAPSIQQEFFLAVRHGNGTYVLKRFTAGTTVVTVSADEAAAQGSQLALSAEEWSYCFEEDYPMPGDYDYNDVVISVQKRRTGDRELQLGVTLDAVGGDLQMAGAIRLAGVPRTAVESVTAAGSRMHFKGDYPMGNSLIERADTLQAARNGDAVIRLFEDAHWAAGDNLVASYGQTMGRHKINTSPTKGPGNMTSTPRTVVYTVTFVSAATLDNLTMDQLDVFIVKPYNTGVWEVHTPAYRNEQVLRKVSVTHVKGLPWALAIPTGSFRWPIEGEHLGYYKDKVLFGAYMELNHSFGQWAADSQTSTDWYLHPTNNLIY